MPAKDRVDRASASEMRVSGAAPAESDGEPERVDGAPDPTSDALELGPEALSVQSRGMVDGVSPECERTGPKSMFKRARARARRAEQEAAQLRESRSPMVEAAEREVVQRTDELVAAMGQAQRTADEVQKAREAVVEAEDQTRITAQRAVELRARLEEEGLVADEEAEQQRFAEAAALERRARDFDEAEAARKRRSLESYRTDVSAAAKARAEAQRLAHERAAEARIMADRAEAAALAFEAAVGEAVTASEKEESEAIKAAEVTARADAEAAAAERDVEDEQRAARIEAFEQAESERQQHRERSAKKALGEAAEHLAASEAGLGQLRERLVALEQQQAERENEVAAREASVAHAEKLADAARNGEARSREARQAEDAARQGAREAETRAAAARAEVERATAQAEEAAMQAAELIREAEQLSAEARQAEQLAAASARSLDVPGSKVPEEPEDHNRPDIEQSSEPSAVVAAGSLVERQLPTPDQREASTPMNGVPDAHLVEEHLDLADIARSSGVAYMTTRGTSPEAPVKRFERVGVERVRRRSPARATRALHTGSGTEADLNVLYEEQEPKIREKLLRLGVDRVLEPDVLGYQLWYWASRILACPPDGEVPDRYRKELAARAALVNPYGRLSRRRPKVPTEEREKAIKEWIVEQLCLMFLNRNDELELRREVADRVPIDPAELLAYRRVRREERAAQRRTNS